jgi:ADP-ribosylglycohydrolase
LLGLAWGDVLGSPVEGWRRDQIRRVYGDYRGLPDAYPLARIASLGQRALKHLRPLGLHSDDTQQALALIHVGLASATWSSDTWADWLVEGMRQKAWRGYGRNFRAAVRNLHNRCRPQQAGSPTAGIGAAMRIGPVGALYRDDPDRLAEVVWQSSLVTHGDIRAGAMAYAIAHSVAALVAGRSPATVRAGLARAVAAQEARWLKGHAEWTINRSPGHQISDCLGDFFAQDLHDPEEIRRQVSAIARPHVAEGFTRLHPNQGFVLLGGLHGLVRGLAEVEDPAETLTDIIAQGYDTDTVAAISGSLLGARFGTGWIPRARLLDRARLEAYADALVDRAGPPEDRAAFLKREADLTRQEADYQAQRGEDLGDAG